MKKIFSLYILLSFFWQEGFTQEYVEGNKSIEQHTSSLIIRVHYIYKQGVIENRLSADLGSDKNHPLSGKLISAQDRITITYNGESKTYNNEIDLFNALSKLGWKIVSANVLTIINTQYIQYLLQN
jgi:hypothetical protein